MRRVRRSSKAWICTACGARSRFLAKTQFAICNAGADILVSGEMPPGLPWDAGFATKYDSEALGAFVRV